MHLSRLSVLSLLLLIPASALAQNKVAEAVERANRALDAPEEKAALEFLKPLVNHELSFIKRACELSDQQMPAIVAEASKAYSAMSDMVGNRNQRVVRDEVRFMGPNQEQLVGNPYLRVRKDAAKYLEPLLSTEQYQRYLDESKQRDEFERRAAIGVVVDLLDNRLVLTTQQRTQLVDTLMKGWHSVDVLALQNYLYNPQYLPPIPEQLVKPVLTPAQTKLWTDATRTRISMFTSMTDPSALGLDEQWIQ